MSTGFRSRTVVALTGASFLCAGLSFSYLHRMYDTLQVEYVLWVVWTLLGFGGAWLRMDKNPAAAQTHWKWLGFFGVAFAIYPGFFMFNLARWMALMLMLVIGARAVIMHSRRDFYLTLTAIFVVSFLSATHGNADWTLWVYLGPCWLFAGLALTWDYTAGTRIPPWTKALLNSGFVMLCLVVALAINAVIPRPNVMGFGFLPPGTDRPGLFKTPSAGTPGDGRVTGAGGTGGTGGQGEGQGSLAGSSWADGWTQGIQELRRSLGDKFMPEWQRDLLGQMLELMDRTTQALSQLSQMLAQLSSALSWWNLLSLLLIALVAYVFWRRRYRIGMQLAMALAWVLCHRYPLASMRISAAALGWALHVKGHVQQEGQSVREHWNSLPQAPAAVRIWLRTATDLYGAVRFGGRVPTPASADKLRQLVTVTADALLRR
jgi:hypothetical protein